MQSTLSTVPDGGRSDVFFAAPHARALDELRIAQMALAQAWTTTTTTTTTATATTTAAAAAAECETRRLASDAHFRRVADGVADVAQKLDRVVAAMAAVEVESRRVWLAEG
jgi:uncharacterized membrane protein